MMGHGRLGRVGPIAGDQWHGEVSQDGCLSLAYTPDSTNDTLSRLLQPVRGCLAP